MYVVWFAGVLIIVVRGDGLVNLRSLINDFIILGDTVYNAFTVILILVQACDVMLYIIYYIIILDVMPFSVLYYYSFLN